MSKILMVGDVHGEWGRLNTLINKKRPDLILQTGDFGYWPDVIQYKNSYDKIMRKQKVKLWPPELKLHGAKLYWCGGNHENWPMLNSTPGLFEEPPSVFYMQRRAILTLHDGRNVMFMGGAESIDPHIRTEGFDWFREETIRQGDVFTLPHINIDIIVSHTCPEEFPIRGLIETAGLKIEDPSRKALSVLLNYYKPSQWYFGHYHKYETGIVNNCKWTALSMSGGTGWWEWLIEV